MDAAVVAVAFVAVVYVEWPMLDMSESPPMSSVTRRRYLFRLPLKNTTHTNDTNSRYTTTHTQEGATD